MRNPIKSAAATLLGCLLLAAAVSPTLGVLTAKKRFFELRRTLEKPVESEPDAAYYRAMAQAHFGHESSAIELFQSYLASKPTRALESDAHDEMGSAFLRLYQYGKAADELSEALRLKTGRDPGRADTENSRLLYDSLRGVPPQTVEFGADAPVSARLNPLGSWNVPVELNGMAGDWIFDTGANLSTLSESEAARLGLKVRESAAYVNGSTGEKNPVRLAVAGDLRFGPAHLHNVVFLVVSDEALYISPLKYQIGGVLGMPVLRALGCVGISAKGEVQIPCADAAGGGDPNLFFDGSDPVIEANHGGHNVQMFLDTGANNSSLYASFRDALSQEELQGLKMRSEHLGGAGRIVRRTTQMAPALPIGIGGKTISLTNVSVLSQQPSGKSGFRDGVIGVDALKGGFTLDFRSMRLRLQ